MNSLTEFINYELYPALFSRIDTAFPDMEFSLQRSGQKWGSPKKLDGTDAAEKRRDKSVITAKVPSRILEQGGETLSLVDFQLKRSGYAPGTDGEPLLEAVRYLASVCGLEVPSGETEEYRAYREKQERREALARKMQRELFSPAGAETLSYLREVRGYSEETIRGMGLGFVSREAASQMEDAPYGAGDRYTLAIPYRSGNTILGFKLRTLDASIQPKYKNTSGLSKKASLFGLTGLRLTGYGKRDRDLIVVEGELDALRAQTEGVANIAAAAGGEISTEALLEAKKRGVERVTILFDTEESEEHAASRARAEGKDEAAARRRAADGIAENKKKREKAIRNVSRSGLSPLVASFPSEDGAKVDTDSYLSSHSVADFEKIVEAANTGAKYLFFRIYDKAVAAQGGGEVILDRYFGDYKRDTVELLNDAEVVSPTDREEILRLFEQSVEGAGITKESLREEADRKRQIEDARRQTEETVETARKALNLAVSGRVEESIDLMRDRAGELAKIAKEKDLSEYLYIPTREELRERLRNRPSGVPTGYLFSSGAREERLTLPAGAVTLVCGLPSHGKSVFLRNLALQVAQQQEEGSVLYFTIEEDYESTFIEFVNTYVNKELTKPSPKYNNLTTIAEYYQTDSTRYMKQDVIKDFKEGEARFNEKLIQTGKLRIYDTDFYAEDLVETIRYLAAKMKIRAVFVDYVQLLHSRGTRLQPREELKEISKHLRQTAKELKLPIVLAAQLNRDAKSPSEMRAQNIAESADLEREANKVVLLWNSKFRPLNGNAYREEDIERGKRLNFGTEGKIYALMEKNRGGISGLDTVLDFNGNTGAVAANFKEKEEEPGGDLPISF